MVVAMVLTAMMMLRKGIAPTQHVKIAVLLKPTLLLIITVQMAQITSAPRYVVRNGLIYILFYVYICSQYSEPLNISYPFLKKV